MVNDDGAGGLPVEEPRAQAVAITTLVDALLPGDDDFPSGAEAGVQTKLAERLVDLEGEAALEKLLEHLSGIARTVGDERRAMVQAFESEEAALFATVRSLAFLAYYENPFVQAAIRRLGFAYNATPLPKGYGVRRFDMSRDVPTHGRGRYIPTDAVEPVDLSGLDIEELRHGQ